MKDACIINICEQLLFVRCEEEALVDLDPYAPNPDEKGPNRQRYEALTGEYLMLCNALSKVPRPKTLKGFRALAEVAMMLADRTFEEKLAEPEDFAGWLWLFTLSSVAGKPEQIPLPPYWPV